MSSNRFHAVSRRIREEKTAKQVGVAEVKLHVLDFPHSKSPNAENVQRLARLFKESRGCRPGDLENRIPAIIKDADLREALALSGLSREALHCHSGKFAKLEFPPGFRLECLAGQARVQAAEEVSRSREPRWVVSLFIAGLWRPVENTYTSDMTQQRYQR